MSSKARAEFVRSAFSASEAPEDEAVLALCERVGFGAVMGSASRQWAMRDPRGFLCVGLDPFDGGTPEIEKAVSFLRSHGAGLVPIARDAWNMAADMIEKGLHLDAWEDS